MFAKTIYFLLLFHSVNGNTTEVTVTTPTTVKPKQLQNPEVINSMLDSVCLTSPHLNVTVMNNRLISCRGNKQPVPIANLDKAVTLICEHLQSDIVCFRETVKVWTTSNCIKSGKENIFNIMIKIFTAGRNFKCNAKRKLHKNFLSSKGEKCMKSQEKFLTDCESSIVLAEPWVTLETLYLQSKEPYSKQECRQKGLWTYCAIAQLEECKEKTAAEFYRGFYGSMLMASPCQNLIAKEFPALQRSAISLSTILYTNYYSVILFLFIILIFCS